MTFPVDRCNFSQNALEMENRQEEQIKRLGGFTPLG